MHPRHRKLLSMGIGPETPVLEWKGELVGAFASMDFGALQEVRKVLDENLPHEKWARAKSPWGYDLYRLDFCGGSWRGDDASKVPGVMRNNDVTLEFWPDGVALRFIPLFAEPLTKVEIC